MPSQPNKMQTLRIRSAGPMTLSNYTDDEISHLRKAVSSPKSKIKYLALAFHPTDRSVQVVAQAFEKLSTAAWREALWRRLKITASTGNLQATVCALRKTPGGFEEYGLFGRHGQLPKMPVTTGIVEPPEPDDPWIDTTMCYHVVSLKQEEKRRLEDYTNRMLMDRPEAAPEKPFIGVTKGKPKTQLEVLTEMRALIGRRQGAREVERKYAKHYRGFPLPIDTVNPAMLLHPIEFSSSKAKPGLSSSMIARPSVAVKASDISLFLSALVNQQDGIKALPARDLFTKFEWFVMHKGSKTRASEKAFGGDIKDIGGITKKKASAGLVYTLDIAAIKAFLVGKNEYDQAVKFE